MRLINSITALFVVVCLGSCSKNETTSSTSQPIHNVFVTNPICDSNKYDISLPAIVQEARTISVAFKTAGQAQHIYVKEGDYIKPGQLIAQLDTTDYALGISALRAQYDQMTNESKRINQLHAAGSMSQNDYEKFTTGLRQLSIKLQLEENRLAYCTLRSPAAGIVTKINFEKSEMVDAGSPFIELLDNSSLEAIVDLPVRLYSERETFSSFVGESALAPGKLFPMEMLSLTPIASNNQLYRLRLGISATEAITAGMNITVHINQNNNNHGLTIPLNSVFEDYGKYYVWVVNPSDNTITATEVTISGTGEDGKLTVTSGLTTDDIIVRAGVHHLTNGEKVNILAEDSKTNPGNLL